MSIASQITRIQTDRNTIRAKLVELGLASNTDNLDILAEAVAGIENKGSVSATVKEGETYTIPKGFHDGSGTVSGIAGGGNYSLQSKAAITPTKKSQQITPDDGYYGLSDVTIAPIPDAYQDVTAVTAGAADVLVGKTIVNADGQVIAGSMVNNGAVTKTLTTADASFTVAGGYHNGEGVVKIVPEDKSVTPTKEAQNITAASGKVLNKVTVAAIPDEYQVVTGVTATAAAVRAGYVFVDATGAEIEGTMENRTGIHKLDVSKPEVELATGYHEGSRAYIELEEQTVTPSKVAYVATPADGKVLSQVTVEAIPDNFQDVTKVTATADKVLTGSDFVDATGAVVKGSMANNGAQVKVLDASSGNQSATIAKGYHNGEGAVSIVLEEKNVTPTKSAQTIAPSAGKVLSKVSVAAIPAAYQDVTAVDAEAAHVLDGKKIVSATGEVITGSMANNGDVSKTIDGLATMSVTIPAGYTTGGTVSLTSDIEDALAAI